MRTNKGLFVVVFLAIITIGAYGTFRKKVNGELDEKQVQTVKGKTYEQGLWDGFNRTIEYLHSKNYLTKDSIKIEIMEVDSVLHSTKR